MSDFPQKIVCVDDEAAICDLIRDFLALSGEAFSFEACASGAEFLETLDGLQPDFLILDVTLGDMSGQAVLEALQGRFDGPVLLLTGAHNVVLDDVYRGLGVVDVVHKPFDPNGLIATVREAWGAFKSRAG